MKAILDTHAFIWMDDDPAKVSSRAQAILNDANYEIYLSVVSIWEIVIKSQIGKLSLRSSVQTIVDDQLHSNPLHLLSVEYGHVLALEALPAVHRDPFDRLLAAQAVAENAVLLSCDPIFAKYPVSCEW